MNIEKFTAMLDSLPEQSILRFQKCFVELVAGLDIESLILDELVRCQVDYKNTPRMRAKRAMSLVVGRWYFVDLMVYEDLHFTNPLTTHPSDMIFYFFSDADYTIHRLGNYRNRFFGPETRAVLDKVGHATVGNFIPIDSDSSIVSLKSTKPIVALTFSNRRMSMYSWDFDYDTGAPLCYYNNYSLTTILELMTKLLGSYGDEHSVEALKLLVEHESDTVKWQAAYALLRVVPDEGVAAFRQLSRSDNPIVAKSATLTLTRCTEFN